ncbi:hypothetical protein PFLUV_G00160120 [Perca fluviatilis]|uniref:Uncharacterized protein n=1 Tax=Perca fluviatilis TaxID=8168 RepID=A0A6A5EHZ3_PERFL|nr:hypothetical protein PFLUV_G00160120 [Perca fluviatilis]
MSSGFCVRVLVLSLVTFGQQAKALSYRSGGFNDVTPHFDFQRRFNPASSENLEPAAAPSAAGSSGSYGWQMDGYSQEGSVSSYGPGHPVLQEPRQNPQQPPQTNPNTGFLSSNGIKMDSIPQHESTWWSRTQQHAYPAKLQKLGYPARSQQHTGPAGSQQNAYIDYPSNPVEPSRPSNPVEPSRPSKPKRPSHPLKSQKPGYLSKPQSTWWSKTQQHAYPAKLQKLGYPARSQQHTGPAGSQQHAYLGYPSKPLQSAVPVRPQQPTKLQKGVTQTKVGMWDLFGGGIFDSKPTDTKLQNIASSYEIMRDSTWQAKHQQPIYLTKHQPQSIIASSHAIEMHSGPQSQSTKSQQPAYLTKHQPHSVIASSHAIEMHSGPQSQSTKSQQPAYQTKSQQKITQHKAGIMSDFTPLQGGGGSSNRCQCPTDMVDLSCS